MIVIGDGSQTYGVVVDRFLGERMLVVQPLDPRLGKIRNITASARSRQPDPVLIADVDDWLRSVGRLVAGGDLRHTQHGAARAAQRARRVLVVDDSLTMRGKLERKLLATPARLRRDDRRRRHEQLERRARRALRPRS